ncbi:RNA polymerase sigma factor SigZ [Ammoniphilus sp. CFH 90114]|nr:RNA polymerase sigma factor SigZ [Ammoniphilus sp. CFH 90114]
MKQVNLVTVWQDFRNILKQFIKSRVSNEQDTDDILQEVFIKIHHHLPNLKEEDKLRSWVFQITRNTIIDFYRSRGKNQFELLVVEIEDKLIDKNSLPADGNKNEIVSSWLKDLTEQLPENDREALLHTEYGNLTQRELAAKLGISLSGAKSRVQRGREKLKHILLECCHLEFDNQGNILDYEVNKANCSCKEIRDKMN